MHDGRAERRVSGQPAELCKIGLDLGPKVGVVGQNSVQEVHVDRVNRRCNTRRIPLVFITRAILLQESDQLLKLGRTSKRDLNDAPSLLVRHASARSLPAAECARR